MEERTLQSAAGMETGREIVGSKSSPQRGTRALQKDRNNEKDRKADLHVGQHLLEQNH